MSQAFPPLASPSEWQRLSPRRLLGPRPGSLLSSLFHLPHAVLYWKNTCQVCVSPPPPMPPLADHPNLSPAISRLLTGLLTGAVLNTAGRMGLTFPSLLRSLQGYHPRACTSGPLLSSLTFTKCVLSALLECGPPEGTFLSGLCTGLKTLTAVQALGI